MRVRIKEARKVYEQQTGQKLTQEQLALILWPECKYGGLKSKMDTLNRMQSGRTGTNPNLEIIEKIALICGVDYNFLIVNDN